MTRPQRKWLKVNLFISFLVLKRIKPSKSKEEHKSEVEEEYEEEHKSDVDEDEDDAFVEDSGNWGSTIHQRLNRWNENSKVLCLVIV